MTLAIIVTAGYAVIDGAHQDVVPGRESCLAGLACDTIGGAAGLMAARIHSGGACDAE
jgi:VanZ family protein